MSFYFFTIPHISIYIYKYKEKCDSHIVPDQLKFHDLIIQTNFNKTLLSKNGKIFNGNNSFCNERTEQD
ncbi:hypothetical protein DFA_05008 [Cavenderia fasciculata]|uniref:Uncharacterized protein n=1 Tax=Cavenderia fasciculata TaxID=261658 RepID=F4PMY5_CACFS|nr:uncharacterized protein DFA_05008 [Cavenderia fasciculata]EGG22878.1 hypothetical protein DFA_05008 [Cavenderia fasciculata]|eukprot:XP_004360729.1 hypothetical protein DFA_05008 [Cavenderia fasciculata]